MADALRYYVHRDPDIFPPIKPKHAQALGYVVANWSIVEEAVGGISLALLGISGHEGGHAVTAELSGAGRFALARVLLIAIRKQEWVDEWDDIELLFTKFRSRRNNAVHAVWHVVAPTHWAYRVRSQGKVAIEFGELSTTDLEQLAEEILVLLDRMSWFEQDNLLEGNAAFKAATTKPPLVPGQSRRALAQAQFRAAKQARKATDRAKAPKPQT